MDFYDFTKPTRPLHRNLSLPEDSADFGPWDLEVDDLGPPSSFFPELDLLLWDSFPEGSSVGS